MFYGVRPVQGWDYDGTKQPIPESKEKGDNQQAG
jgi:hypothetical protein